MELKFQVYAKIQRPVHDVFQAVYDPKQLSEYFTTAGASGPLKEGTTVFWDFADFPGKFPVVVKKVIPNERIAFEWDAVENDMPLDQVKQMPPSIGYKTAVEIIFEALDPNSTLVRISESGWKETQNGLNSSYGNCQGWMNMACCLKAYVEYGINLRKGFF